MYLSDKGRVVAVFEVFGQHLFGEEEFIEHEESYPVVRPSHHILVALILHKEGRYIEKSVGLLEEGGDGPAFLLLLLVRPDHLFLIRNGNNR